MHIVTHLARWQTRAESSDEHAPLLPGPKAPELASSMISQNWPEIHHTNHRIQFPNRQKQNILLEPWPCHSFT